jgi:hypothetical protein
MRSKSKRKPASGKRPNGRPTKKNSIVEKQILELAKTGLPLCFAAASAGIGYQTLVNWRERDPQFSEALEVARMASVQARWDLIQEAAKDKEDRPGDWRAAAWSLERTFASQFSKPEIQLGVAIQNNVNGGSNNGHSFESVIVSDLEFLGLRKHENYSHRPHERPARDVDSTVVSSVPEDLSGTLVAQAHPGCSVVSESQAQESRRRLERANAEIAAAFQAKRAGNGNGTGNGAPPSSRPSADAGDSTPTTGLILAPIVMPQGEEPTSAWWNGFTQGDNGREVQREAALYACKVILREVAGPLVAQNTPISFESELVTLRDVHSAIQDMCGPRGWAALLRKAGRE